MKRTGQRLLVLLLYLAILLYVTGFCWENIWDIKAFGMVVAGMLLLSVPQLILKWREIIQKQQGEKATVRELLPILSWNAMAAAYLTAVMMLLTRLNEGMEPEQMISEIALGLRPILYGLLFYVLFHKEEKTEKMGNGKEGDTKQIHENNEQKEYQKSETLTSEQLCYFFRAKGLTAREAEVAKLLYQGCSNREIAVELYIAETTVKKHVTHILEKLKIEQRGQIQELVLAGLNLIDKGESDV